MLYLLNNSVNCNVDVFLTYIFPVITLIIGFFLNQTANMFASKRKRCKEALLELYEPMMIAMFFIHDGCGVYRNVDEYPLTELQLERLFEAIDKKMSYMTTRTRKIYLDFCYAYDEEMYFRRKHAEDHEAYQDTHYQELLEALVKSICDDYSILTKKAKIRIKIKEKKPTKKLQNDN